MMMRQHARQSRMVSVRHLGEGMDYGDVKACAAWEYTVQHLLVANLSQLHQQVHKPLPFCLP